MMRCCTLVVVVLLSVRAHNNPPGTELQLISVCNDSSVHTGPQSTFGFRITNTTLSELLPALHKRHAAVASLGNDTQRWLGHQRTVHAALQNLFAPLPEPSRSSPRTVERCTVQGDSFVLHRLLIETRPRYWAPVSLFSSL